MKRKILILITGALIVLMFVLVQVLFVVRTGDAVILTTFGKPERAISKAGLYTRWPWPIQKLYVFDNRVHCLEGMFEETYTRDRKNIIMMTYACWRIHDPIMFLQRVGTIRQAEISLDGLIRNYKNSVIGQHLFSDFVNADKKVLKFESIENEMLAPVCNDARERYGIDVTMLGIRKINLPEAITEKVFARMRAERKGAADKYRSEGKSEAIRIRAGADKQKDEILCDAEAKAKLIRAEGDAEAAKFYESFNKNPELAIFLRKLDVLEETLKEKSTVVLGTDTVPFDLFRGEQALPSAVQSDGKTRKTD